MTQEQKELLLKDLCGRLPYEVKISVNNKVETLQGISTLDNVVEYGSFLSSGIEDVKPYLLPLSIMTEEQKKEYAHILVMCSNLSYCQLSGIFIEDLFNKYHFDYRGLIPKGLAIDASGLNIY